MRVLVRGFEGEDVTALARLWHDSWASTGLSGANGPSPEQYEERLCTEGKMWSIQVAAAGNDLLGFMACRRQSRWLRQLFVTPAMQRLGIGTLLLDRAKQDMPGGFWLRTHPSSGQSVAHYLWPATLSGGEARQVRPGRIAQGGGAPRRCR